MADCSFCGRELVEGEGLRLFRRDGSVLNFCSRKCERNQIHLKRNPAKFKWTLKYASTAKKAKAAPAKESAPAKPEAAAKAKAKQAAPVASAATAKA